MLCARATADLSALRSLEFNLEFEDLALLLTDLHDPCTNE